MDDTNLTFPAPPEPPEPPDDPEEPEWVLEQHRALDEAHRFVKDHREGEEIIEERRREGAPDPPPRSRWPFR